MQFENLKIKCECGGRMQRITTFWRGIEVKGWRCVKCNEEVIDPLDAQKALDIEKAKKRDELTVKLRKVGKSSVITVPQIIVKTENLRDGQKFEWHKENGKLVLTTG